MPAKSDLLHLGQGPRLLSSTSNSLQSRNREFMFRLCRPPSLDAALWKIREEKISHDGEGNGNDAVDDEEPSPAFMAMYTIQVLVRSCLEETTEHLTDRTSQPEYHRPLADLAWSVPRPKHVVDTRVESRSR